MFALKTVTTHTSTTPFSKLFGVVLAAVTVLAIDLRPAHAQARGFAIQTPANQLAVGVILDNWQAIQNDLRVTVGKDRRPEFEFRLLAPSEKLPERVILVLGGLQGSLQAAECFARALDDTMPHPADTHMAVFGYPNDGSIAESGAVLKNMLAELHEKSPATKVSIVAHSMGGLVARCALEPVAPLAKCESPCVDQLIMICPPNHGSVLAQYADALEFSDAVSKLHAGTPSLQKLVESLVNDGLGEACEELVPHSAFLRELNSRPRAPGVRYCIVAGTGGPISPLVRLASSVAIRETKDRTRINTLPNASDLLARADELLLSDEFAQGMGDGAVSVASSRLEGVTEFQLAPVQHGEWAQVDKPSVQALVRSVASLLTRKPHRASF